MVKGEAFMGNSLPLDLNRYATFFVVVVVGMAERLGMPHPSYTCLLSFVPNPRPRDTAQKEKAERRHGSQQPDIRSGFHRGANSS